MSERRAERRRIDRRAFRPTLDGRLESRRLQAHVGKFGFLYPANHIQTASNGQAVDITTATGESFFIDVANGGTVKAYPMSGGRFGLTLSGTNAQSVVTINPVIDSQVKHTAHIFNTRQGQYNGLINLGSINVVNGQIDDILGYKTAVLSGPLLATATNPIDRLAFFALAPGANIITGGDVNTLDVATSVILSGANTGINIGRDLNFFSTFGDVDIINNANFIVGRNIGTTAQLAKGTGPSSIPTNATVLQGNNTTLSFTGYQAFSIQGNVFIAPGSHMAFGGAIGAEFLVNGTFVGFDKLSTLGLLNTPSNTGSIAWVGNGIFFNPANFANLPTLIPLSDIGI